MITPYNLRQAAVKAVEMLNFAQVEISGHRVGAAVIATNGIRHKIFGGCNIELATSEVEHAERAAMKNAITAGFVKPEYCFVTSIHEEQQAAMCGTCLQYFMYCVTSFGDDHDCKICVVRPDTTIKLNTTVRERNGPNGYLGHGKLSMLGAKPLAVARRV